MRECQWGMDTLNQFVYPPMVLPEIPPPPPPPGYILMASPKIDPDPKPQPEPEPEPEIVTTYELDVAPAISAYRDAVARAQSAEQLVEQHRKGLLSSPPEKYVYFGSMLQ